MHKRWESKKIDLKLAKKISSECTIQMNGKMINIPLSISRLLVSIGIKNEVEVRKFLTPNLNQIHNPFLLKDMKKAVERINLAIDKGEKILGYGDYDCDGVTTTSLMKEGFRLLGVEIDVYAPNRFVDGYGLNPKRIDGFAHDYDLIISGDTGIRAFEAAKLVKKIGQADLIVTDHHEPHIVQKDVVDKEAELNGATTEIIGDEKIYLPDCYAVIDQQRLGDDYPFKSLAGVGVVFKVLQALFMLRKADMKPLLYLLDLVATGTIADLAKQIDFHNGTLDFENRVLCKYGIAVMNQQPKPWVKAISISTGIKKVSDNNKEQLKLMRKEVKNIEKDDEALIKKKAEIENLQMEFKQELLNDRVFFDNFEKIDSTAIGFRLGPTLNAPGRLEDPMPAIELLLEKDENIALEKAHSLKKVNTKRQAETKEYEGVINDLEKMDKEYSDYGIVVQSESFHIGIAGLIAGKVQQHYYRPAIALAPIEKNGKIILKGSARSIPGVHILRCLDYVKEKIGAYEYGGHEQAAGLALEPERFDEFRSAFREACMEYDEKHFIPCLNYDAEVTLGDVNENLINFISLLEPFGEGMFISDTKKPLFRANKVKISELKEIMDGKGCILTFTQDYNKAKGVMFNGGEPVITQFNELSKVKKDAICDILFSPEFNYWNGNRYVQLMISDIKFH